MKNLTLVLAFWLLPCVAAAAGVGSQAPPFVLYDSGGRPVTSDSFRGKVLVVAFWATWCSPCRQELSALETLYRKHRDAGLVVVGISVDSSEKAVRQFAGKVPVSYTLLMDTGNRVSRDFGCSHLPTVFFISRDGVIRSIRKGFSTNSIDNYDNEIITLINQVS